MSTPQETPLIYSADMVNAYRRGNKTQTRRLEKSRPGAAWTGIVQDAGQWFLTQPNNTDPEARLPMRCPFGGPGDVLWGRENFFVESHVERPGTIILKGRYAADDMPFTTELTGTESDLFRAWKRKTGLFPSIYLFRSLSRIRQVISGVRLEHLQSITEADAIAEGVEQMSLHMFVNRPMGSTQGYRNYLYGTDSQRDVEPRPGLALHLARDSYISLWDSLHGPGSKQYRPWSSNPLVWVLEFPAFATAAA